MATQGAVPPVVLVEGVDGERGVVEAVMDGERDGAKELDGNYTIATHFVKVSSISFIVSSNNKCS